MIRTLAITVLWGLPRLPVPCSRPLIRVPSAGRSTRRHRRRRSERPRAGRGGRNPARPGACRLAPRTATTLSFPDVRVLVLAYELRRKSIIAVLTSGARSCWVQWPADQAAYWSRAGSQCRLLRDELGENGRDKIALARHVQRGNGHRRSGEGSHQLPAAINICHQARGPCQSPRVFLDVNVDI